MACSRCLSRRPLASTLDESTLTLRRGYRSTAFLQDAASPSQLPAEPAASSDSISGGLHILKHKSKLATSPNDRPRSALHNIDISKRLGTRYARPVVGGMEWQTSTYHYNKQTSKNLPVLTQTANKLLEAYSVLRTADSSAEGRSKKGSLSALAQRRKQLQKMYVSATSVKDYGGKLVINAFAFDGKDLDRRPPREARPSRPRAQGNTGSGGAGRSGTAAGAAGAGGGPRRTFGGPRRATGGAGTPTRAPAGPGAPSRAPARGGSGTGFRSVKLT